MERGARAREVRASLGERFAATVGGARLHLPPALRESLVGAALLDGAGCPEPLASYYTESQPRLRLDQLARRADAEDHAARALLDRSLDRALADGRLPLLRAALDGLLAALDGERLDAAALLGATTATSLVAARPTVEALYAPTLFASALPMVGAYPAERALVAAELAAGADPDAVIDRRLSGGLLHELCHGLQRALPLVEEVGGAGLPPWLLTEAAALHLGLAALPRHVLPDEPGEAVPGVSLFVLVGEVIARRRGRRALWRLLVEPDAFAESFGARAATALAVAGWQDLARRREPPFARDALRALDWARLVDAATGPSPLDPLLDEAARVDPLDGAALARLPDLLDAAAATPWETLPWWRERPAHEDERMLAVGVRALFQVNVLAPTFQTHPDEAPAGRLTVDVTACTIAAERRAHGVFAEPARWIVPPPIARALAVRGARRVIVDGARRRDAESIGRRLVALAADSGPLDGETRVAWTSSA